jgi:hypothetical protein
MADRWSPLISAAAGLTGVWKQRQYDLARRQLEEFLLAVLCPTGGDPRKRRDSRTGQYGGGRGMDRGLCWSDRPRDQIGLGKFPVSEPSAARAPPRRAFVLMAGSTGLEPATSGLTVQCANQAAPRARS